MFFTIFSFKDAFQDGSDKEKAWLGISLDFRTHSNKLLKHLSDLQPYHQVVGAESKFLSGLFGEILVF